MPSTHQPTPLVSLEAVALDTETTGLDARSARLVEVAVLKVRGETIVAEAPFVRLVNPGLPMPATASEIHGLRDVDVREKPDFSALVAELDVALGRAVVIGHD